MNLSWYGLALCSAVFLGFYDLAKKAAVRNNAIPAVLFWSVVSGALPWLPFVLWSKLAPETLPLHALRVAPLSLPEHALLFLKSFIAGSSWAFAYAALKHLPLSVAAPIRATSPLWTILVATLCFGERPNPRQWLGIAVILGSFYAFTWVSQREGIDFRRNRHVGLMLVATLLASASALYDKYLLQRLRLDVATVQAWFSIYLVAVTLPWFLHWRTVPADRRSPFEWRRSIPAIGLLLLVTDFLYFSAVHRPDAMISLVSPLRRTSVLVSLIAGVHLFRERQLWSKILCVTGLLAGVFLLSRLN